MARKMKRPGGRKKKSEYISTFNQKYGLTIAKRDIEAMNEIFKICGQVYNHFVTKLQPFYCEIVRGVGGCIIDVKNVYMEDVDRKIAAEKAGIAFFSDFNYEAEYEKHLKTENPLPFEEFVAKRKDWEKEVFGQVGKEYPYKDVSDTRKGKQVIKYKEFNDNNEQIDAYLTAETIKKVYAPCLVGEETKVKNTYRRFFKIDYPEYLSKKKKYEEMLKEGQIKNGEKPPTPPLPKRKSTKEYDCIVFPSQKTKPLSFCETIQKATPGAKSRIDILIPRGSGLPPINAKITYHRELKGRIMQVSILRKKNKRFEIMFTVDIEKESNPLPKVIHNKTLGVDVGFGDQNYHTYSQPVRFPQYCIDKGYVSQEWATSVPTPLFALRYNRDKRYLDKKLTSIYIKASQYLGREISAAEEVFQEIDSIEREKSGKAKSVIKTITKGVEKELKSIFFNKNTDSVKKEEIKSILDSISNLKFEKNRAAILNTQRWRDFEYIIANVLASQFDIIVVEDLALDKMLKKDSENNEKQQKIRKYVARASLAHGRCFNRIEHVCKRKQVVFIKVNPQNTSKTCSNCGYIYNIGGSKLYQCSSCGLQMNRDENAARNILARGISQLEGKPPSLFEKIANQSETQNSEEELAIVF